MFGWLQNLFSTKSAVDARRGNPLLDTTVQRSAEIYATTPVQQFIDAETADRLAREYFLICDGICNAEDPRLANRQKLAEQMLRFALYQVLLMESEGEHSDLIGLAGITTELEQQTEKLARSNIALRSDLHASPDHDEAAPVNDQIRLEYWKNYWLLETLNAARIAMGDDAGPSDWFAAFKHAACASQENLYRIDLDLPSAFPERIASRAGTAYSIFTDIVVSGEDDPLAEWCDYHAGGNLPVPGEVADSAASDSLKVVNSL